MQNNGENYSYEDKKPDYEANKMIIKSSLDAIYGFILEAYSPEQLNEILELNNHSHSILLYDNRSGNNWDIEIIHNKLSGYADQISCKMSRLPINNKFGDTPYLRSFDFNNQFPIMMENIKYDNRNNDGKKNIVDNPEDILNVFNSLLDSQVLDNGLKKVRSNIEIVPFNEAEDIRFKNCKFIMNEFDKPCSCGKHRNKKWLSIANLFFKR